MDYNEFIQEKIERVSPVGFEISKEQIKKDFPILFDFQVAIVQWGLRIGRCAVFAECGLGKSFIQLVWAHYVAKKTGKPVLLLAPLGVTGQTVNEAKKLGLDLVYCRTVQEWDGCTNIITNYEMLKNWDLSYFSGGVWDESSILKNYNGKTKQLIFDKFHNTNYLMALTATPAPNDARELGNHAEGLRIMKSNIMERTWFKHDSANVHQSILKPHAANDFWRWVNEWAVCCQVPSDLGDFDDTGYILPDLNFIGHVVEVDHTRAWAETGKNGQMSLLLTGKTSATNMHAEKRATIEDRMEMAAQLVRDIQARKPDEYIIVWCEYNYEADLLVKLLPDAIEIRGNESIDIKQRKLIEFAEGMHQVLITKPKIAAHGLNFQHVGEQIWTSITHKFEPFYQGYKRSHRFGRKEAVNCHIIYAESEGDILSNLNRKHHDHEKMQEQMVKFMKQNGMSLTSPFTHTPFGIGGDVAEDENWKVYHGDSAIQLKKVETESVSLWVQSPPFKQIFVYSDNAEDLGNCINDEQFYQQYQFILKEQLRASKSGNHKAEHCQDLAMLKQNTGHEMGLIDFPGELIKAHIDAGWEFVGSKTVWKDPVVEMQRTKRLSLLWSKSFCEKSEQARQGIADYVLIFRKPDGKQNVQDKKELAPIAESVVMRCADLWTNHGENVHSPYHTNTGLADLLIIDGMPKELKSLKKQLRDGRNLIIRVNDLLECTQMIEMGKSLNLIFHSRVSLTDGSFLIVLRKWVKDMSDKNANIMHVTHDLIPPSRYYGHTVKEDDDGVVREYDIYTRDESKKNGYHQYIGTDAPQYWDSDAYYSIQVWQRYASPVWWDLPGLPESHPDIWMDIQQTDVLEYRIARDEKDEKHIAPLQLQLIERCIEEYTNKGDLVGTGFAGIFSEIYQAVIMGRRAVGCELKRSYWEIGVKHMAEAKRRMNTKTLFDFIGVKV